MENIIEIYGKNSEQIYNFIDDYNELLYVNMLYLEDKISFTLFNKPKIDINKLVQLNKLGFLVLEGNENYIDGILESKYMNDFIKFMDNKVNIYISSNKFNWFYKEKILYNTFYKVFENKILKFKKFPKIIKLLKDTIYIKIAGNLILEDLLIEFLLKN
jgi:hypothetical protein